MAAGRALQVHARRIHQGHGLLWAGKWRCTLCERGGALLPKRRCEGRWVRVRVRMHVALNHYKQTLPTPRRADLAGARKAALRNGQGRRLRADASVLPGLSSAAFAHHARIPAPWMYRQRARPVGPALLQTLGPFGRIGLETVQVWRRRRVRYLLWGRISLLAPRDAGNSSFRGSRFLLGLEHEPEIE